MTKEEKDTTQAFMKDFWKFFKKYLELVDSEAFWDEAVEEADKLMQKYGHDPVFDQTIAGYIAGIDMKRCKATGRWKE